MYRITLFSFILISQPLFASTSLSIGASSRTYPALGSSVELNTGYGVKLWKKNDSDKIMFGLIEPKIKLTSSLVINEYDASITLYPISFIGIGAGHSEAYSNYNKFKEFDCKEIQCIGSIRRNYQFMKIALGYKDYLMSLNYRLSLNSYTHRPINKQVKIAEYQFANIVTSLNERHIKRSFIFGKRLTKKLTIAFFHENVQFIKSNKDYQMNIIAAAIKSSNSQYTFGLGSLESSLHKSNLVAIFSFTHDIFPSIALF